MPGLDRSLNISFLCPGNIPASTQDAGRLPPRNEMKSGQPCPASAMSSAFSFFGQGLLPSSLMAASHMGIASR